MISSIIRRYKLYRKDMNFEEIHIDTHSFLMTKIDKFKPSKEKKAYSYFGTICKSVLKYKFLKIKFCMNSSSFQNARSCSSDFFRSFSF